MNLNSTKTPINKWVILLLLVVVSLSATAVIWRGSNIASKDSKNPSTASNPAISSITFEASENYIDVLITSSTPVIGADIYFTQNVELERVESVDYFKDVYLNQSNSGETYITAVLDPALTQQPLLEPTRIARLYLQNSLNNSIEPDLSRSNLVTSNGDILNFSE